jgi:DNA-binding CsgD family transcriptional regulator
VAVRVARGRRNPQVAAASTIAPRTAARHVEHGTAQPGVHSRAEVAPWAAQQGLLGYGGD